MVCGYSRLRILSEFLIPHSCADSSALCICSDHENNHCNNCSVSPCSSSQQQEKLKIYKNISIFTEYPSLVDKKLFFFHRASHHSHIVHKRNLHILWLEVGNTFALLVVKRLLSSHTFNSESLHTSTLDVKLLLLFQCKRDVYKT